MIVTSSKLALKNELAHLLNLLRRKESLNEEYKDTIKRVSVKTGVSSSSIRKMVKAKLDDKIDEVIQKSKEVIDACDASL